tara:strand:- start:593 stop:931 length:339 start_codon:yes stop_codon:yes gene_type:complete
MAYCTASDVAIRLGLDTGQQDRAASRLTSVIARADVFIDECFREYGRGKPSLSIVGDYNATLREIAADLAASIYLEDESVFHQSGSDPVRSNVLRARVQQELTRIAHAGLPS